jgi:pimeloyl-ACP methyl ester carboxylesterase
VGLPPHLGPHHIAREGVAIDMPGFGHSDQPPELIAPESSGAFLARLIDQWGLGAPHIVGPDVGTAAALFLAAKAPERVTSLTIGGGAVRYPIEAGGALKDIIEAPASMTFAGSTPEPTSATRSSRPQRATLSPRSTRTT